MVDNESVDKIVSQIREDGEREMKSILEKADQTASEIISKAESQSEAAVEKIRKEALEKGETARRRLLSSVNIEVKRAKLKAREDVVNKAGKMVEELLAGSREKDDYPEVLAGLVVEALRGLDGSEFQVYADRRDVAVLKEKVFPAVIEKMSGEAKEIGSIEALPLEKSSMGGVRVGVPGGKVIYDNTFEARIYRMRDKIRNIIFESVFEPEGSEGSGSA